MPAKGATIGTKEVRNRLTNGEKAKKYNEAMTRNRLTRARGKILRSGKSRTARSREPIRPSYSRTPITEIPSGWLTMLVNVPRVAEAMRINATTVILPCRLSQHRKKITSCIATTTNGKCTLPMKIALNKEKARVNNIITDMSRSSMLAARARLTFSRCLKGALAGGNGGAVHMYHHSRA